jgi:hypothetical protein
VEKCQESINNSVNFSIILDEKGIFINNDINLLSNKNCNKESSN